MKIKYFHLVQAYSIMKVRNYFLLPLLISLSCCSTFNNIDDLWKEAAKEDSLGHFNRSILLYDKIIKLNTSDSSDAYAFTNRGRAKISSGDTLNGIVDLNKAILIMPLPQTLLSKAMIEMSSDPLASLNSMRRAKDLAPTNPEVYYSLLGFYTTVMINKDSALSYADYITEHFKDYRPMSDLVMSAYLVTNKFDKLITISNLIIQNNPDHAFAYNNRGYAELNTKDYPSAKRDINKSISLNPKNSYAYKNLGLYFLKMKQIDSSCVCFNIATNLGYTNLYGKEVDSLTSVYCKK